MLRPKRKIVMSVHGIRTRGAWQKQIAPLISESGWIYYPLDYGYFSALHFALPFVRKAKIKWFCDQFDNVRKQYPGVRPSVVCHSNGTYIVANALKAYPHIHLDKIILCGSIVRTDFDWNTIFVRKQATLVRNEIGIKDIWALRAHWLAWGDTGPSGQCGFSVKNNRLSEATFPEYGHASFQAYGHYEEFWLPFLDEPTAYQGEVDPPWYSEEPVSPYDAARWSAMTYYYQYIARVHHAIAHGEAFANDGKQSLPAKCLWVIIPKTPGKAAQDAVTPFYQENGLETGFAGASDRRTFRYHAGQILYDIPTTLNTMGFLDHRTDTELDEAVNEFQKWLLRLIQSSRSPCADTVHIKRMEELPAVLA
jgi:hypothetical protein